MVFYIEPQRHGLDRRVFRRTPSGALEWAHYLGLEPRRQARALLRQLSNERAGWCGGVLR